MTITNTQKKIVNPFAESRNVQGSRGLGYDYGNQRNGFILDAIHESYLNFYKFPAIDTPITNSDGNITLDFINTDDLNAYCALYPQNGTVGSNGNIQLLSDDSALQKLSEIAGLLIDNDSLEKYSTTTSKLTFEPEFAENQRVANLLAIPKNHSNAYTKKLRISLGLPTAQASPDQDMSAMELNPLMRTYLGTDTNVDIYDWRNNCLPGEQESRTYYNPSDAHYYYTKRTKNTAVTEGGYALNYTKAMTRKINEEYPTEEQLAVYRNRQWSLLDDGDTRKQNWSNAYNEGIKAILAMTGKLSSNNEETIKQKIGIPPNVVLSYKDPRPGSTWSYTVRIPATVVNILPESQGNVAPSYEDLDITVLEKAKRIVGISQEGDLFHNKTFTSVRFRVEELQRYLVSVRFLLREYAEIAEDKGFTPSMLSNIDLEKEVDRLSAFMDYLSFFYSYNKISIQDSDQIEFFLSKDRTLDHICINGIFYDRGCGNRIYSSSESELASFTNAFSLMTPTTFSIVESCYEIAEENAKTTSNSRIPILEFMDQYIYPKVNLGAYKASRNNQDYADRIQGSARRESLFQQLSEITKTAYTPEEMRVLFSNRKLTYKISSTLTGIGCDTGQAKAAKYALKFYQAATGKTRVQSLVRETILLIRNELIRDLVEREVISRENASYANEGLRLAAMNPARFRKEIETYIDQQIFCSLDVIGDFIQDEFLDPQDAPPLVNNLVRKTVELPTNLQIEFKKAPMVSLKGDSKELYKKAIQAMLYNFIKSIVAGVAKDIISALLGCGPETDKKTEYATLGRTRRYDYGLADLEEMTEGIDIVSVANSVGLVNLVNFQTEETTPATVGQLNQMLEDTSNMCTPMELQLLIDGDSSDEVIEHLMRFYKSDKRIAYRVKTSAGERATETLDSTVYNNFTFTKEKVIDFFFVLGKLMRDAPISGQLSYNSPLEVYCETKDPYLDPLLLQFPTPGELENQYMQIAEARIAKINSLCGWLRGMENIQLQIERLIANLPMMQWYNDLLEFLAYLSNLVADYLGSLWASLFNKPAGNLATLPENLYHNKMGSELFFQIFPELRNMPISSLRQSTEIRPGVHAPTYVVPPGIGSSVALGDRANRETESAILGVQIRHGNSNAGTIGSALTRTNFGDSDVNTFIYNHVQYAENDDWWDKYINDINGRIPTRGAPRLRLPQYIMPIQPEVESYDMAYYAMRNAPQGLSGQLLRHFEDPIATARTANQRDVLSENANHVYDYLTLVRSESPYIGYPGYTWFYPWTPQDGGIRLFYREADDNGYPPLVGEYHPTRPGVFHLENAENLQLGEEGTFSAVDYRIFNGDNRPVEFEDKSIFLDSSYRPVVQIEGDDHLLPQIHNQDTIKLYANFSIGYPANGPEDRDINLGNRPSELTIVNNFTERIDTTINNVITSRDGQRRLPKYIAALNKATFNLTDDDCVTQEEVSSAQATVKSIQARMQLFFLNTLPLARIYPAWGSRGTVSLITDYLYKKYKSELDDRGLYGTHTEGLNFVSIVYPHDSQDDNYKRNPIISKSNTPEENTRNLIEALYLGMLDNISEISEYVINDTLFRGEALSRYKFTLAKMFSAMASDLADTENSNRSYGVPEGRYTATSEFITEQLSNGANDVTDLGLLVGTYYMPVAFLVANYLIYYDRGVKFGERYSDSYYRASIEIAHADDRLVSAIARRPIQRFANLYSGFPLDVKKWDSIIEIKYYNEVQLQKRIDFLNGLISELESVETSLGVPELSAMTITGAETYFSQYIERVFNDDVYVGGVPPVDRLNTVGFQIPEGTSLPESAGALTNASLVFYHPSYELTGYVRNWLFGQAPPQRGQTWRNGFNSPNNSFEERQIYTRGGYIFDPVPDNLNSTEEEIQAGTSPLQLWFQAEKFKFESAVQTEFMHLKSQFLQYLSGELEPPEGLGHDYSGDLNFGSNLNGSNMLPFFRENLEVFRNAGYGLINPELNITDTTYYANMEFLVKSYIMGVATFDTIPIEFQSYISDTRRGLAFLSDPDIIEQWLSIDRTIQFRSQEAPGIFGDPNVQNLEGELVPSQGASFSNILEYWIAFTAGLQFLKLADFYSSDRRKVQEVRDIDIEKSILDRFILNRGEII